MSMAELRRPCEAMRLFVVMGVSGCGKSTIASALAKACGGTAVDGDDFHPADNIRKMSAGIPLTDADRWPWLEQVGRSMRHSDGMLFCACSALKRKYREHIAEAAGEPVLFLHLQGSKTLIAERMQRREGHFMPDSLLESQFATLEVPGSDECAINVDIAGSEAQIVATLLNEIGERT